MLSLSATLILTTRDFSQLCSNMAITVQFTYEPTLPLMTLLQMDSVKIAKSKQYLPYEIRDIYEVIKHCITIPYGKPTDISPDITITLNNAGHIMGSATVHLNISGYYYLIFRRLQVFQNTTTRWRDVYISEGGNADY